PGPALTTASLTLTDTDNVPAGDPPESLAASRSRLVALTRDLSQQWQATAETWTDAKRVEFERAFLVNLFAAADRAAGALEQLDEVVSRVRRDCE
ncbi:MAG: hypothetical protein AB7J34_21410, partial [Limisphaerales bacterium]